MDLRTVRASQIAQRAGISKRAPCTSTSSQGGHPGQSIFLCVTRQFERFLAALEQAQSFEEACTRVMDMVAASAHSSRPPSWCWSPSLGGEQLAATSRRGARFFAERAQQITQQMDDLLRRGQQRARSVRSPTPPMRATRCSAPFWATATWSASSEAERTRRP